VQKEYRKTSRRQPNLKTEMKLKNFCRRKDVSVTQPKKQKFNHKNKNKNKNKRPYKGRP
jgi:hypothetical protein